MCNFTKANVTITLKTVDRMWNLFDGETTKTSQEILADEIESKRDPTVLYKFTPCANIETDVRAHFMDGKPVNAYFGETNLGPFTLERKNKSDFEYILDKQWDFQTFLKTNKNFFLEVGHYHDGCVGGWFARAFDSKINGKMLVNLEDIDLNSQ